MVDLRRLLDRNRLEPSCARFARLTRATIVLLPLMGIPASAQDVTEPVLKATFIYNFAKFTEWPANLVSAEEPFVICVIGAPAVAEALERTVKGRLLDGRTIAVSDVPPAGPPRVCHIMYVSGVTAGQSARLVAGLRDGPVLTISDIEGFTELGGIARFFFEQGRLRFGVNLVSARRARLQISSRLLALAK